MGWRRRALIWAAAAVLGVAVWSAEAAPEHVVRRGETLSGLAARYGVSVEDLMAWNGLSDPHRIRVGQRLVVGPQLLTYTVRPGDTLQSIASRFGTSVKQLASWNGLTDPNRIYPGQELVVSQGADPVHVVEPGDTLWEIARRYGLPADVIAAYNGVKNPHLLRVGQQLVIPVMATGGGDVLEALGPVARPGTQVRPGQIRLVWPVEGRITSRFGPRWGRFHYGLDIAAPAGTRVRAAAAGVVTYSGWAGGYGRLIVIDHGNGVETRYGHHSENLVRIGDKVKQGQVIGRVGSTGNSTGPHLHFEVLIGGEHRNPEEWLPRR